MISEIERRKVLEVVRRNLEIEELLPFQVPYPRICAILRDLLESGLICRDERGLWLTDRGEAALSAPIDVARPNAERADRLASARMPQGDPEAVHVPASELD